MYGACLKRLVNWACAARKEHPTVKIYASKVDFKSAYRRCHLNPETALQSCTQLKLSEDESFLLMFLRLTFGGTASPNEWCTLSESVCDLATAILQDEEWDPSTLASPSQKMVPLPHCATSKILEEEEKLGLGKDLIVSIPINPRGTHDIYIDDLIGLTLDVPGSNNVQRCAGAHLLAIAATARPSHVGEPIPREEMEAVNKLVAEATPEETKVILGWLMNFHKLIVSLPINKFQAWSESIQVILVKGSAKAKDIETLI